MNEVTFERAIFMRIIILPDDKPFLKKYLKINKKIKSEIDLLFYLKLLANDEKKVNKIKFKKENYILSDEEIFISSPELKLFCNWHTSKIHRYLLKLEENNLIKITAGPQGSIIRIKY